MKAKQAQRKARGSGKRKPKSWSADTCMTENALCSILIATGIFHDSEYGQRLERLFHVGAEIVITISEKRPLTKRERE